MAIKFGTDGIRGKYGEELTIKDAYACGNSFSGNIIIGQDTRASSQALADALIKGASDAGCLIINVGICPTACIAYLTKLLHFDYGVVITASHNTYEYNGIKVFSKNGKKLTEEQENSIENFINSNKKIRAEHKGFVINGKAFANIYRDYVQNIFKDVNLNGLKIVLDCANGACYSIAPNIFKQLGATIVTINAKPNGLNINYNCGSLHLDDICASVTTHKADIGFAFDGDGDRVIAIDKNGKVIDGDMLLYMLATIYKEKGVLNNNCVVGTVMTNIGIERALNEQGINLIRTDVGDKNVSKEIENCNLILGAEQSGHIISANFLQTGDGILNALNIASICSTKNTPLHEFFKNIKIYPQCLINVKVFNKTAIINNEKLQHYIKEMRESIGDNGRIVMRASGTEPYIRIMVEADTSSFSELLCNKIARVIDDLNLEHILQSQTEKP